MPTEEIKINPKLTDYELRLMATASRYTKMSRFIFKSIHKFAVLFKLKRLRDWAYLKWLNTYTVEQFGFWKFAGDYLNCDLIGD
jgi:hypothetical protein